MNNEQNGQTRTEQPTPRKLREARSKGQVARSRELNTTVVLLASSIALIFFGEMIGESLYRVMETGLTFTRFGTLEDDMMILQLTSAIKSSLVSLFPFFLITVIAAFVGPLVLGGWSFSYDAMKPKWSRMSLLNGFKRMFGVQGLIEMLKAFGKFLVIGGLASAVLWMNQHKLFEIASLPSKEAIQSGMYLIGALFVLLSLSLIVIVAIDVPYQLVRHIGQLKMSIQEVREEAKQTTGNPEVKSQQRSLQREISTRRMLQDVVGADVIVTNPDHFSVALRYDQNRDGAPRVVAKGVDFLAFRIRDIARANNVELFAAPPLARSLYHHAEVGQEIPRQLYQIVAQILAYVYQIKSLSRLQRKKITRPSDYSIPDALKHPSDLTEDTDG